MAYRVGVSTFLALLGIISVPSLYKHLAGLENGKPRWEGPLRGLQCIGSLALAVLIWVRRDWFREGAPAWSALLVFLSIAWPEFAIRLFFKHAASRFKPDSVVRNLEHSVWEQSSTLGEFYW